MLMKPFHFISSLLLLGRRSALVGMEGSTVLLAGVSAQGMQVMNLWEWWCCQHGFSPCFLFWLLFLFVWRASLCFFLPSPCDLGFITAVSPNKTTGVRRRNKLVMMFS